MERYVGLEIIAEGDEPLRGETNGHDPMARQMCVDT